MLSKDKAPMIRPHPAALPSLISWVGPIKTYSLVFVFLGGHTLIPNEGGRDFNYKNEVAFVQMSSTMECCWLYFPPLTLQANLTSQESLSLLAGKQASQVIWTNHEASPPRRTQSLTKPFKPMESPKDQLNQIITYCNMGLWIVKIRLATDSRYGVGSLEF